MSDDVREIGDHPMRYVRSRQHDLFEDKDRAVRHVRGSPTRREFRASGFRTSGRSGPSWAVLCSG